RVRDCARGSRTARSRRIPRRAPERSAAPALCRPCRRRGPDRTGALGGRGAARRPSPVGGTAPRSLARRTRRFLKGLRPASYNALAMNLAALAARLTLYERLMRLDKPIGTLLLLWPTLSALWLASDGKPAGLIVWIFVLGTLLMRSAGCVINDLADWRFDADVKRTRDRPLATCAIRRSEAYALATVLTLVAFALVLALNRLTVLLSFLALGLAATYDLTKRFVAVPQAYLR